ncbi:hypothetical protein ES705_48937 [subsurface metagenome]
MRFFRETGATIAGAGMEKLGTDTAIQTHRFDYLMNICIYFITKIGNLINKGNLGSQEGITGIFD